MQISISMEYLALIAENELLRTENEKYKQLLKSVQCPRITQKGVQCKNNITCKVHGMPGMLRQ
jgi:hypothetical protein